MEFADGSFDGVIDKGTIDSVLVSAKTMQVRRGLGDECDEDD